MHVPVLTEDALLRCCDAEAISSCIVGEPPNNPVQSSISDTPDGWIRARCFQLGRIVVYFLEKAGKLDQLVVPVVAVPMPKAEASRHRDAQSAALVVMCA